jgi:hypothetical protein
MTRKDYIALADAIAQTRRHWGKGHDEVIDEVAKNIADVLAADNGRFDRGRFIEATTI